MAFTDSAEWYVGNEHWIAIPAYFVEHSKDASTGEYIHTAYFFGREVKRRWEARMAENPNEIGVLSRAQVRSVKLTREGTNVAVSEGKTKLLHVKTLNTHEIVQHTWGVWEQTRAASCTEPGEDMRVCADDSAHVEVRSIDALGHAWGDWVQTKPATCVEPGEERRVCTRDPQHVGTRLIPVGGHVWDEPHYTWSEDHTTVTARAVCKEDDSHVTELTVTSTYEVMTEPTATEVGEGTYTAVFDQAPFSTQMRTEEIPATGEEPPHEHEWGEWIETQPCTETEDGVLERRCAQCGEVEQKPLPAATLHYEYSGPGASWTKGDTDTLPFTFKRTHDDTQTFLKFAGIKVDEAAVDESCYEGVEGSVVITLGIDYLNTLEVGDHVLQALFEDGNDPTATFVVQAKQDADEHPDDNPAGDADVERPGEEPSADGEAEQTDKADQAVPEKQPDPVDPSQPSAGVQIEDDQSDATDENEADSQSGSGDQSTNTSHNQNNPGGHSESVTPEENTGAGEGDATKKNDDDTKGDGTDKGDEAAKGDGAAHNAPAPTEATSTQPAPLPDTGDSPNTMVLVPLALVSAAASLMTRRAFAGLAQLKKGIASGIAFRLRTSLDRWD